MVSVRDAKKAQKKIKQQADAYKEACKLVDEIYNDPNSIIDWRTLGKALRVIEGMDSQFAADIKKDLELREAYQIVGGYNQRVNSIAEEKRFNKALQLVEKDDPQFAQALKELRIQGTSFRSASENQLATAEQIVKNAQTIYTDYSDDSLFYSVFMDKEIVDAYKNTPITADVSDDEYKRTTFAAAQNEAIPELAENVEYSQANAKKKRNLLVSHLKTSVKGILFGARRASGGNDIASIKKALNFEEEVPVSVSSIASAYENAQTKSTSYIKKLYQKGHTKAAAFLNKAKTIVNSRVAQYAKVLTLTVLMSCGNGNVSRVVTSDDAKSQVTTVTNTAKSSADIVSSKVSTDSISTLNVAQQSKATGDSIVAPTEWSDSLGVSKRNWTVNQTFMDYGKAYQKISDDMLAKSGFQTRDQFLNAYRILRSFYPNVIENQGDVLLARTETSEKLSKFFNNDDCVQASELTTDDYEILKMAPTLSGNLNVRSTQEIKDKEPCEAGKVQYENVATQENVSQEPVKQTPESQVGVQEQSTNGTGQKYTVIEEGGSSRVVKKVVTDTVSTNINVLKGRSFDKGHKIGEVPAEEIIHEEPTVTKNIVVERKEQTNSTAKMPEFSFKNADSTEVNTAKTMNFSFKNADDAKVDTAQTMQFTFKNADDAKVDTAKTMQFSFKNADDAKVDTAQTMQFSFKNADDAKVDTPQTMRFTFKNADDAKVDTAKTMRFTFKNADSSAASVAETDSVQIVSDSADLPVGTPAAGYVEERGGVNNCGLTAKQLQYSKSKIADRYGDSAYEDLMDGISDEMLSKGNIFEGLTREQAIYNLSVWSVVYPHSEETSLIYDYVLNCHQGETMSADDAAKAKAAMDKIRINKTIDGTTYTQPIYVKNVKNMGCDEKVQVNSEQLSVDVAPVSPSGPKFLRLFRRVFKKEPVKYVVEELGGTSRTVVKYVDSEPQPISIDLYKGGSFDTSKSKHIGKIDAEDIVDRDVTNKKILVERTSSEATAQTVVKDADKQAGKKLSRKQRRELEKAEQQQKKQKQKELDKYKGGNGGATEDYYRAQSSYTR